MGSQVVIRRSGLIINSYPAIRDRGVIFLRVQSDLFKSCPSQILISILLNWLLCGILTVSGVLTDDKNDIAYRTRTDAAGDLVATKPWFSLPYPGKILLFYLAI